MKFLKWFESLLTKCETILVVILLIVMLILGFTQVLLRNIFHSGIVWGDIVLRHLVLWIGFVGALLATTANKHISIDVFTRFLSPPHKLTIQILIDLFSALICTLLFHAALTFVTYEIDSQHTVYADIPSWYAQSIIPLGYGLLSLHFLLRIVSNIYCLLKGGSAH
ncbi:MAG: TRAP transporter small permease [Bacteroidetes bacterium]|nr:TRAP transporter small permease [Bacteroidota bacterium]